MKASVDVICYKSKILKNGESPLMLRISKSQRRKYISVGISVSPRYWDFDKNKPKRNCPNKEAIDKLIASKLSEYNSLIMEMTADQREYTPESLAQTLDSKVSLKTVEELYDMLIADMRKAGKLGNAAVYKYSRTSLLKFNRNSLNIPLRDIDNTWLKRYEYWLRNRDCKDTTISQLFRTLRSVFNKALEMDIIKQEYYPFNKFKLSKFDLSTQKRAISKSDIHKILQLDFLESCFYMELAKDMFIFSYFGAGINFTDIALLKHSDIKDNRLHYIRRKTGKSINFPLCDITKGITAKYNIEKHTDLDYIFPILNRQTHKTELQKRNRIHKALGNVNKRLKDIGEIIGVDNLTTYIARHSENNYSLVIN